MFCHKCGNQIADGAAFCHKCGTKIVVDESVQQVSVSPPTTLLAQPKPQSSIDSIELFISIAKVEGRAFSKLKFSVFIDNTQIGELPNGGMSAYKITPGQHCVKIGSTIIWINVPKENNPITLNLQWGVNIKPEIVCPQSQLVMKPSETEKITMQAMFKNLNSAGITGLVCIVLGAIGFIVGLMLFPSYSGGGIVTAEQHIAISAAMDFALPFVIGGFAFAIIGAIILILSSRKKGKGDK